MASRLAAVVFEARDVSGLAAFWARALGVRAAADGVVGPAADGTVALAFVASDRPKTAKNRLHLDVSGGADQGAEVGRLLALGARRADIGQGDVPWDVLADPEGNEFCVLPEAHAGVAGGLAQICLDAGDPAVQGGFWAAATGWAVTERGAWGVRLRAAPGAAPSLVMGPPAAPKPAPNRVRFALTADDVPSTRATLIAAGASATTAPAVLTDPEGNEFSLGSSPGAGGA
ncbi:hypothetical protein SAMN05216267_1014153 [Actinacidiphila rubida]|uniref:Glyoxalase-like domain-containing protein n=1 Tax=Actinacidiphila rubida TaxID=310780 RepID=A0A1H8KYR3_9ACTN|nr:VOC family protein [Actinacidiphila rubida]SEN98033.1 hypothetical protein SAMN05216267_1014153 [Actinacidiphila rubida]